MRFLVISDLHANLEALAAVLDRARDLAWDRALVLGDLVGYGADPDAVVEIARGLPGLLAVRGNHDRIASGEDPAWDMSPAALRAAVWTRRRLSAPNREFLAGLPPGPLEFRPGGILAHGSPVDEDEYLLDEEEGEKAFAGHDFEIGFFGHTHLPVRFVRRGGSVALLDIAGDGASFGLDQGDRHLINPGSVGQPRDGDPRASFAIFDDDERQVTCHRVPYDADAARRKILEAGLPSALGDRLLHGI
jgi:diadenosine tetraphosphatase ApaH/serine/threonine PP2A family protein phosphatase